MKILIKAEKTKFFIILPTALLLNRAAASIVAKIIKTKFPNIDIGTMDFIKLIHTIMDYKQKHGRLEIVNIRSADGEVVYISL